jgi:hypothetical protein
LVLSLASLIVRRRWLRNPKSVIPFFAVRVTWIAFTSDDNPSGSSSALCFCEKLRLIDTSPSTLACGTPAKVMSLWVTSTSGTSASTDRTQPPAPAASRAIVTGSRGAIERTLFFMGVTRGRR